MGKNFMGYNNASELLTAIGNKIKAKYTKPNTGIPKSDLSSDIQNSLVEVVDNGVKNVCDLYDAISYRSCSPRRLSNGGLHLECTNTVWTQYFSNLYLEPNTEYVLFTRISNFSGNIGDLKFRVQTIDETTNLVQYSPTQEGEHTSTFVTGNNLNLKLAILINDSATARTQSADIWVMICTKAKYDISPDYEPHALGNQVLTPSLIKQVDSGPKNRLDDVGWMNAVSVYNGTKSVNNGAITLTSTAADCYTNFASNQYPVAYRIPVTPGETIVLSWKYSAGSGQTNDNVYIFPDGSSVGANSAEATKGVLMYVVPAGKTFVTFRIGVISANKTATWSNIMCCSLDDWNVSHKYAPFAKSNYELTQYTDGCTLDTASISSGSLDDIATNAFAVYAATVTGKPVDDDENTSAFTGLCRTDVYNSSEAMQTLRRLSNSHTWVRTKTASTWNPWIKQGAAPYIVSSNTASASNLLYDAAKACGLSPTAKIHSGMISVTTGTNGESLLVFFTYKHGVYADAQSITNNVISYAGAINNLGTFGVSGGTAPYTFGVMFFN